MRCPKCGREMTEGEIVFKRPWPGAFYPKKEEEPSVKHQMKLFLGKSIFGSKGFLYLSGEGEGWYCENCEKVIAVLKTE